MFGIIDIFRITSVLLKKLSRFLLSVVFSELLFAGLPVSDPKKRLMTAAQDSAGRQTVGSLRRGARGRLCRGVLGD